MLGFKVIFEVVWFLGLRLLAFLLGSEVKGIKPYNLKTSQAKRPNNLTNNLTSEATLKPYNLKTSKNYLIPLLFIASIYLRAFA